MVTVSKIIPKGHRPLKDVKQVIVNRIRLEKAKNLARAFMEKFSDQVKSGVPFKKIAENDPTKKLHYNVTGFFTISSSVPGIGYSPEFNATAFALNPGEVSDLVGTDRGYYYIKLLEKTKFDSAAFNAQKDQIRAQLLTEKRNQVFNSWYESLKAKADIVDNRKMFNL